MDEAPETIFKFTAEGVDLEFAGTEEFVERQVLRFQQFLEGAVGLDGTINASGEADTSPRQSFEEFCADRPPREGRGAIQDRILLAVYYLRTVKGKREVSGDDIVNSFRSIGWVKPKNLHNALGILKRKVGHLEEGSRRGLYRLSSEGSDYMSARFE